MVCGWVQIYDGDELAFEYLPHWSADLNEIVAAIGDLPLNLASAPRMGWGDPNNSKWRAEIPYKPQSYIAYADEAALAVARAYAAYLEDIQSTKEKQSDK